MYKISFFLIISLFFVSCTNKNNAFMYFEKADEETKGIQHTKKIDILKNNEVETIFLATYLNKIDKDLDKLNEEDFLVSLYFANSSSQEIEENNYTFLLNGTEPFFIKKIEKDDEKLKNLMLKNTWGNYYLIKFKSFEDINNLSLTLKNEETIPAKLNFGK